MRAFITPLIALVLGLSVQSGAVRAQSGQLPSGYVLGNGTASSAPAAPTSQTSLFDRWCSSTQGSVPNRGASSWQCTTFDSLLSSAVTGDVTFNSSGVAAIGAGKVTDSMLSAGTFSNITGLGTVTSGTLNGLTVTGLATPSAASDAANKSYVDLVSSGFHNFGPSRLATAAVLPNTPTYSNGSSGVGATLTAGSNTTLTVDGTTANLNDIVLVKTQASALQNGLYYVSAAGSGAAPWVLTRCTVAACGVAFNSAATMPVGTYTFVTAGSANANTSYSLQSTVTTVGTDAVTFALFFGATAGVASVGGQTGALLCGGGLDCSTTTLNVKAAGVTNAMLAGLIAASKLIGTDIATVGTLTAGATGSGFTIALGTSTITGTLGANHGGTGATTLTSNGVLYGNGTGAVQATSQGAANSVLTANAGAPAFSASPTIGTSVTTPLVQGGAAANSTLTVQSTSGAGSSDAIVFKTGSQSERLRIATGGASTFSGDAYFKSGKPWVDVTAFCGIPDSTTDMTSCLQSAIDALEANYYSGAVYFPSGNGFLYCAPGGLVAHNLGMRFLGASREVSKVAACGGNVTVIEFASGGYIEHMTVYGTNGGIQTSEFGVTLAGANYPGILCTGGCFVDHVTSWGGSAALEIGPLATDSYINDCYCAYGYAASVLVRAGSWWIRTKTDTLANASVFPNYPVSVSSWAPSSPITAGTIINDASGAYRLIATQSGTTGMTQPNFHNGLLNWTDIYTGDGTVRWTLFSPVSAAQMLLESSAYEVQVFQNDFTGSLDYGIATFNTYGAATVTASIANGVMTVTGVTSGAVGTGQFLSGTGVTAGTLITNSNHGNANPACNGSPCTGRGGTGTYAVSGSDSLSSRTITLAASPPSLVQVTDSIAGALISAVSLQEGSAFFVTGGHYNCSASHCGIFSTQGNFGGKFGVTGVALGFSGTYGTGVALTAGNQASITNNSITGAQDTAISAATGITEVIVNGNHLNNNTAGITLNNNQRAILYGNDCFGTTTPVSGSAGANSWTTFACF